MIWDWAVKFRAMFILPDLLINITVFQEMWLMYSVYVELEPTIAHAVSCTSKRRTIRNLENKLWLYRRTAYVCVHGIIFLPLSSFLLEWRIVSLPHKKHVCRTKIVQPSLALDTSELPGHCDVSFVSLNW